MAGFIEAIQQLQVGAILRAILLIGAGYFLGRIVSISLVKSLRRKLTRQQAMLVRRFSFYLIFALFIASSIQQLGFQLTALLGATGILTVAIGIASQTSFSNIISGIFIIGEKPFEIGDTIKVNDMEGEVMSIDLLSVKIRTQDNMMVRLPNETLVKSSITNISYFPKRRVDLTIGVSYNEDLERVKTALFAVATNNHYTLKDLDPSFLITQFGDSAIQIKFSVWCAKDNYNIVKTSMHEDIKKAFANEGISMPFPTRTILIEKES